MNATLACEQAFWALWRRGGKRKESLQLRLWNLKICIEKFEAKCWLAEMTLVMTSLPLGTCFSMFVYIRARFRFSLIGENLTTQSTWSNRGIGGGIQIPETKLEALLPFPTTPPERSGELARRLTQHCQMLHAMLRPFAHPVACCGVLLGVVNAKFRAGQTFRNNVGSFCVLLHLTLRAG